MSVRLSNTLSLLYFIFDNLSQQFCPTKKMALKNRNGRSPPKNGEKNRTKKRHTAHTNSIMIICKDRNICEIPKKASVPDVENRINATIHDNRWAGTESFWDSLPVNPAPDTEVLPISQQARTPVPVYPRSRPQTRQLKPCPRHLNHVKIPARTRGQQASKSSQASGLPLKDMGLDLRVSGLGLSPSGGLIFFWRGICGSRLILSGARRLRG